jgi:hypothetical protein
MDGYEGGKILKNILRVFANWIFVLSTPIWVGFFLIGSALYGLVLCKKECIDLFIKGNVFVWDEL